MQQVLLDASLREVNRRGADGIWRPAGELARQSIGQSIAAGGPKVYAPFAQRAAVVTQRALADGDVAALLEVGKAYPNASASGEARVGAGRILLQRQAWRQAARILHHALDAEPEADPSRRAELMGWIGASLAQVGAVVQAADWFERGRSTAPSARIAYEGRSMTWDDLAAAVGLPVPAAAALPRLTWPPVQSFQRMYPESVTLLAGIEGPRSSLRSATCYVHTDDQVHALDLQRDVIRWTAAQPFPFVPRILDSTRDQVVLAGPHVVTALARDTGAQRWQVGTFPAGRLDPNADHEDFPAYLRTVATGDALFALRSDGQVEAIDLARGHRRWTYHTADPLAAMTGSARLCALGVVKHGEAAVIVLDADSGAVRTRVALPDGLTAERCMLTADETLIVMTTQQVLAFDARSGVSLWRAFDDSPLSPADARLEVDGLYYLAEGNRVVRLSLGTGRALWRSPSVSLGISAAVRLHVVGAEVLVAGDSFAMVIDRDSGALRAVPSLPAGVQVGYSAVTEDAWLLFDVQTFDEGQPLVVHAFAYRDALGPLAGEQVPLLPEVANLRRICVYDQVIVTVIGRRLVGHRAGLP
jgi:hypothetical protein